MTQPQFKAVQAFAASDDIHVYGYCNVINAETGVPLGTVSINSAEEATADYFLSGESICGYSYDVVGRIELTKGVNHLVIVKAK